MSEISFSRRFIALTLLGYVTAVGASVLAVWFGSGPVLSEWQNREIQEKTEANARSVQIALREIGLRTQILAKNPEIVKITIGDVFEQDRARDQLQNFGALDGLSSVYITDFSGEIVLMHRLDSETRSIFNQIDHKNVAREMLTRESDEFRFSFRPAPEGKENHFIVAQPIRFNNQTEGILSIEVTIPAAQTLAQQTSIGTVHLATDFQVELLKTASTNFFSVPVAETDFFVVLEADQDLVEAAGEEIIDRVLLAVSLFLIAPFCLLAIAGLRSIVAPHKALQLSQKALKENQKKLGELADIAQRSNDAIVSTDLDGLVTWVNHAFTKTTGYSLEEVLGRSPGEVLQGPETDVSEIKRIGQALAERKPVRSELLNFFKNGTPYWNSISITPQIDEDGQPYGFVAISSDVTEKRKDQENILKAKAQIEYQANHDPLTGLPNRRALDIELERLAKHNFQRILVRIDLDHFKNVNDTLGHAAGDHVLVEVSELLKLHVRTGDLAARVGGDEFVILMDRSARPEDAESLANRLLCEIQKEIYFEDKVCRVGASFGIASTGDGMLENSELLLGADAALYAAKESGRNCVVSYSNNLHKEVVRSRNIAKEIEQAISNQEFEPFFQPQFDAETFEFVGIEALIRWRHPTRGILPPAEFLSIAAQLSVMSDLESMMLRKGLSDVHNLNQAGIHIPKINFNVNSNQVERPDFPDLIHQISFAGTKVSFELLESVLVEEQSELFRAHVEFLRDIGFGIEVDDFGSGHASIIGLTELAPDAMKIDPRLVFPIIESESARRMIRAIVEIGRSLGIGITAEGVETAAHARLLSASGCQTLQGFFFAEPMPASSLIEFLASYDADEVRIACLEDTAGKKSA